MLLHAVDPYGDGRSLCGDVDEGDPTLDIPAPAYARKGQYVTCPTCLHTLTGLFSLYTRTGRARTSSSGSERQNGM